MRDIQLCLSISESLQIYIKPAKNKPNRSEFKINIVKQMLAK